MEFCNKRYTDIYEKILETCETSAAPKKINKIVFTGTFSHQVIEITAEQMELFFGILTFVQLLLFI
jgi:hypothetical protein